MSRTSLPINPNNPVPKDYLLFKRTRGGTEREIGRVTRGKFSGRVEITPDELASIFRLECGTPTVSLDDAKVLVPFEQYEAAEEQIKQRDELIRKMDEVLASIAPPVAGETSVEAIVRTIEDLKVKLAAKKTTRKKAASKAKGPVEPRETVAPGAAEAVGGSAAPSSDTETKGNALL
ncbi:MAG: hypothetical protein OES13_00255 [Acidimicrobiia bacterium]|nr:hypothetical protein [Acidimicrobiia bacterium]